MLNFIYLLAIFMIPFDNLFFAPSSGWATITPMLLAIYIFLNYKKLFIAIKANIKGVLWITLMIIYACTMAFIGKISFDNIIDSLSTVFLGVCIYFALYIRYIVNKCDYKGDIKVLISAYSISIVYGMIKFISLNMNINFILNIMSVIEKRYYTRVAFTFTEPSFIAMHVYGVILLIYLNIKDSRIKKKLKKILVIFIIITLISKSTSRFIIDTIIIFLILIIANIGKRKTKLIKKLSAIVGVVLILILGSIVINTNPRLQKLSENIYSDASLASRIFRVNATIKGYKKHPIEFLIGKGIGGSYYFLHEGYWEAYEEYNNSYKVEITALYYSKPNQLFCMHIRLISEIGLILALINFILIIYKLRRSSIDIKIILIIIYLYIQFDSYAFYTMPIILFIASYNTKLLKSNR